MVNGLEGTWVKTDEALIATVDLPGEEPPTTPSPPTTPTPPPIPAGEPYRPPKRKKEKAPYSKDEVIDGFLERHRKLKEIFGAKGCTTEEALLAESGIEKEEMKMHKLLFLSDGYSIFITDKTTCTLNKIKEFKKKLDQL